MTMHSIRDPRPILDHEKLDHLQKEVGAETFPVLVNAFMTEIDEHISIMDVSVTKENYSVIELKAHALKSAAYSFGAMQLGDICKDIEYAVKEDRLTEIGQCLSSLHIIGQETKSQYPYRD